MKKKEKKENKIIPQIERIRETSGHQFSDELEEILTRRIEEVKSSATRDAQNSPRNGGHWIFMR